MPEEGMRWLPRAEVLTFEEIVRLARIFVERYEVDGIRLTGGEPTVRAHLPLLVAKLAELRRLARRAGRPRDDHQRRPPCGWSRTTCATQGSTGSTSASTRSTATGSLR